MQFGQLKRRDLLTLLGGAAAVWPLAARGQQGGKLPSIGFLGANAASTQREWTAAFVQRLGELGWVEGRTIMIQYRWTEGRNEPATEFVAEFVRINVNIIVTSASANVLVAKQATSTIPIVFAAAGDPVGVGLVASLARPGGNVTGLSLQNTDLGGKRVELLREIVPSLRRLAIMAHPGQPGSLLELREVESAARASGLDTATLEIWQAEDIAPAFERIGNGAQALYVVTSPLITANRIRLNTLALSARLPTMHGFREYVELGGLISYGVNFADLFRRAGNYVDKILRGAKPADLPVEQPTKFDLVINLTTAKALGLTVSDKLLALADDVIE
jgi:ABC-type uncharacterized transport system substrate-binding protein